MMWPNPDRPGYPLNPHLDSFGHVIRVDGRISIWRWDAASQWFFDEKDRWVAPSELEADADEYIGQLKEIG
jgi:hypothetical protein